MMRNVMTGSAGRSAVEDYAPVGRPVPQDRPVLLLDFDGVINVFHKPGFDPLTAKPEPITDAYGIDRDQLVTVDTKTGQWEPGAHRADGTGRQYHVRYASRLVSDILDAEASGLLTVIWLTSWKRFAPLKLEPTLGMRIPGMRGRAYADWIYRGFSDDGSHGKVDWISRAYETGALTVPFVSADDSRTVGELLRRNGVDGRHMVAPSIPRLAITTDERVGITKGEWAEILSFCEGHSQGRR